MQGFFTVIYLIFRNTQILPEKHLISNYKTQNANENPAEIAWQEHSDYDSQSKEKQRKSYHPLHAITQFCFLIHYIHFYRIHY